MLMTAYFIIQKILNSSWCGYKMESGSHSPGLGEVTWVTPPFPYRPGKILLVLLVRSYGPRHIMWLQLA